MPAQLEYHKKQRVDISGQLVYANILSGNTVIGLVSGQTILATISGQTVQVAGAVGISGQLVYTQRLAPTLIRTRPVLVVPSASGGTQLQSGDIFRATVEMLPDPTNAGVIYLGSDDDPPYSGKGIVIVPGGSWTVETDNFYKIRVFATTSGAKVAYIGEQYAGAVNASGHQVTVVMPGPISISGQPIYLLSGFNNVQNSGQTLYLTSGQNNVQTSGQTLYLINDRVNNVVWISGQTLQISTETFNARVSGETVYLFSGRNIVQISGQVVNAIVSGGISVSGSPVRVSGQVQYLPNDQVNNVVWISGQTITVAGGVNVSGAAVRTSGEVQYLANDGINNVVRISGQTVQIAGTIAVAASLSGNVVRLAGFNGSGLDTVPGAGGASGQIGLLVGGISGQTVIALISGAMVNVSGQAIRISGETVIANISGQTVNVAGGVNVSGSVVRLADINGSGLSSVRIGDQNALVVSVSGQPVTATVSISELGVSGAVVRTQRLPPAVIRTRPVLAVGSQSGGSALLSGDVFALSLQMLQGEAGVVYVGSETDPPFSGKGFVVYPGGAYNVETDNFNRVRLFATTSGAKVSYIGLQYSDVVASGAQVTTVITGPISVSGQVLYLVSGQNSAQISGQTVATSVSGQPVRVSGETVIAQISGQSVQISGQKVEAEVFASGHTRIGFVTAPQDNRNWLGVAPAPRYRYKVYDTQSIPGSSGGVALLSGSSYSVSVRNIGQSGTVMYLGISGDFPWVTNQTSGHGWQLLDGDAITVPIDNPAWLRVVSLTSGQRVSYAISNY